VVQEKQICNSIIHNTDRPYMMITQSRRGHRVFFNSRFATSTFQPSRSRRDCTHFMDDQHGLLSHRATEASEFLSENDSVDKPSCS